MKTIYMILFLFFILTSCETDITFDLPPSPTYLVVDGSIEKGGFALVYLTKSASYFSSVDSLSIRKYIVSTAKVTVSDGVQSEILMLDVNYNFFPPQYYRGTVIKGEVGKTYYLTVESDGNTYTAQTTIAPCVNVDSLWFVPDASKHDTVGTLWGQLSDPANEQNYYRFFTLRKGKDKKFIPIYESVWSDVLFNGLKFIFPIYRGPEVLSDPKVSDVTFNVGDTIILKSSTIDKNHFEFWKTAEQQMYMVNNPFATPTNDVTSNLQGGAIGVWGGYCSCYDTIVTKTKKKDVIFSR